MERRPGARLRGRRDLWPERHGELEPSQTGLLQVGPDGSSQEGSIPLSSPIVRAVRQVPGAPPATCIDRVGDLFPSSGVLDTFSGTLYAGFGSVDLFAGRCAGPRPLDLVNALPRKFASIRTLARGSRLLDLSGRFPFAAGAFSGFVLSSVKVHIGHALHSSGRIRGITLGESEQPSGRSRRAVRFATVELRYRVEQVAGSLATDFRGLPGSACRMLDACEARGTTTYTVDGHGGSVVVLASRRLGNRKRPSVQGELRRARRGGSFLDGYAQGIRVSGQVAERLELPGAPTCTDSLYAEPPELWLRASRDGLAVQLKRPHIGASADTLRTRCAGPSHDGVFRQQQPIARGTLAPAEIGKRTLRVLLGSTRSFSGDGYAGTRHGELALDLRLVRARVFVERFR